MNKNNKDKVLRKLYEIRINDGNDDYLSMRVVSFLIKIKHDIKIGVPELKEIEKSLISDKLLEKTYNGVRITRYGISKFNVKKKEKRKIKKPLIIVGVIISLFVVCYLYSAYF